MENNSLVGLFRALNKEEKPRGQRQHLPIHLVCLRPSVSRGNNVEETTL